MTTAPKGLDLDAIEATLEAMPRIPRFPAYFHDMRLLIEEVKRLRESLKESERWGRVMKECYYRELARNGRLPDTELDCQGKQPEEEAPAAEQG